MPETYDIHNLLGFLDAIKDQVVAVNQSMNLATAAKEVPPLGEFRQRKSVVNQALHQSLRSRRVITLHVSLDPVKVRPCLS